MYICFYGNDQMRALKIQKNIELGFLVMEKKRKIGGEGSGKGKRLKMRT